MYPNPSNNQLNIAFQQKKNEISLQLFNVIGETIFTSIFHQKNSIVLSTNDLSNGIYLLKVSDGENESVQKIIIQH